ncbi:hypothetical protein CLOM_g23908 [Closterium sp. NIES-68]|nr:hypothetical protein CLOM_g23908 [Closterium sp. NIES-68]
MLAASFWGPPRAPSPCLAQPASRPLLAPHAALSPSCAAPSSGLCASAPLKPPATTGTRNARGREDSGSEKRGREERGSEKRGSEERGGEEWGREECGGEEEARRAKERALLKALVAAGQGGKLTAGERAAKAVRMVTPALMRAVCMEAGDMARAEQVVRLAWAAGGAAEPNCRVLTVLARGYCRAGQRRHAYALLQHMEQRGPPPDAAAFHVVMEGESHVEGVRGVLATMRRCHVAPTERTFSVAIACVGRAGDVAAAEALWADMRAAGIHPSPYVFSALAHAYAQAGMVDKCAAVVHQMETSLAAQTRANGGRAKGSRLLDPSDRAAHTASTSAGRHVARQDSDCSGASEGDAAWAGRGEVKGHGTRAGNDEGLADISAQHSDWCPCGTR